MTMSRLFLPLFLAFALLSAQQAGAAHAVGHALEQSQQRDQHSSPSTACDKCENYAQLGSALNVGAYHIPLIIITSPAIPQAIAAAQSFHYLAATARGPPSLLQVNA